MQKVQLPKGTRDVTPAQSFAWQWLEEHLRGACSLAGYQEVRTPVFEHTELFLRGVGDTTDVVQKEMYTFEDKGGRSVTLKPEGTAGVVRMFIEERLYAETLPQKMYYLYSPTFRYEKPQSGRLREHHQFGVECFGSGAPSAEAEQVLLYAGLAQRLGLSGVALHINSIGCPACRPGYQKALKDFLGQRLSKLCPTCQDRYERNPMRILDCKNPACQQAIQGVPHMLDHLCAECAAHFEQFKGLLEGAELPYQVDFGIVRGLDYYTKTVFEFIAQTPEGPLTVCAGGRYDGLVETLGGPPTPGVGFGMGMERMLMLMEQQGITPDAPPPVDILVLTMGDRNRQEAFSWVQALRRAGLRADLDHNARSLKAQMKYAGKLGVSLVLVLGEEELARGAVQVRDMREGAQREVPAGALVETLQGLLER